MKKNLLQSIILILILALTGCGPSAVQEGITTTPTGVPAQASPTAIPYDLTVTVTDQNGHPIPWAKGMVMSSGIAISNPANESGQIEWINMTNPGDTVSITAQGYSPALQNLTMSRGGNAVSVVLEADAHQLNPGTACQPGEKVLYLEDFEGKQAPDLENLQAPNWSFAQVEGRGTVLKVNAPGGNASFTGQTEFGNAVWMFDLSTNGKIDMDIDWHMIVTTEGSNAGLSRYYVEYKSGELFQLNYQKPGEGNTLAEAEPPVFEGDTWHSFAIATFNGTVSVWVDRNQAMSVVQDVPIEKGNLGIEINSGTQAEISFDNFVVCELNGAYTP